MENFIKEVKDGFAFGKMSRTEFLANANKLQQMILEYNLNNWMRRLIFLEESKSDRIETIRTKLLKIASKIVKGGGYLTFQLNSSFPYKKLFSRVLRDIQNLQLTCTNKMEFF